MGWVSVWDGRVCDVGMWRVSVWGGRVCGVGMWRVCVGWASVWCRDVEGEGWQPLQAGVDNS